MVEIVLNVQDRKYSHFWITFKQKIGVQGSVEIQLIAQKSYSTYLKVLVSGTISWNNAIFATSLDNHVAQRHSFFHLFNPKKRQIIKMSSKKVTYTYYNLCEIKDRKLTVKLSTVLPTNSIDLYVAPATDISPII